MRIPALLLSLILLTAGLHGQPVRWTVVDSVGLELWDVDCPDSTTCLAVGSRQYYPDRSVVLKSTNAGHSWDIIYERRADTTQPVIPGLRRISAVDRWTIVVAGDSGVCLRSTDGGDTWTDIPLPRKAAVARLNIHRTGTGMAMMIEQDVGIVIPIVTLDSGATWREVRLNAQGMRGSRYLSFGIRGEGLFVCPVYDEFSFDLIESTNGGANWTRVLPKWMGFEIIAFADSLVGWGALGNAHVTEQRFRISRTTNGGRSWNTYEDPGRNRASYYDIAPIDSLACLFGSALGDILRTTDGGLSVVQDTVPIARGMPVYISKTTGESAVAVSRSGHIMLARFPGLQSNVPGLEPGRALRLVPNTLERSSSRSAMIDGPGAAGARARIHNVSGEDMGKVVVTEISHTRALLTFPASLIPGYYMLVITDRMGRATTARLLIR